MRRRRRKEKTSGDLNLVPIMNLVVCLIPMVLLGMSMTKVGIVEVDAPAFCCGNTSPDPTLGLAVAVAEDGFRLKAAGADLAVTHVPMRGTKYDHEALHAALVAVKRQHPHESTVTLTAEPTTALFDVIATMDTMRDEQVDGVRKPLWPHVSFATAQ